MLSLTSGYIFALTNAGAEKAFKMEVEMLGQGWRPSYQRRGFVTCKSPSDDKPFTLAALRAPLAFARRLCLSLGKSGTREEAVRLAEEAAGAEPLVWHEVKLSGGRLERTEMEPAQGLPAGQLVATVVELDAAEFWTGLHIHGPLLSPDPAGSGRLILPDGVPSRAWLKLEEAARFFGLTFTPRDVVVELGCAPGGVILALLHRGVSCVGVDPAKLAPVVMEYAVPALPETLQPRAWVVHCRKPAALVGKRDLGGRATWFMSDMNQSPAVAIKECGRFIRMCPSIRSALITLKLTDLMEAADKPVWFDALKAMGFRTMRLQQLSVHNRELALLALDRRD